MATRSASSKLSIKGAGTSFAIDTNKSEREELTRIQQDINIISQRVAELKGEPIPPVDAPVSATGSATSSPFVVGLRAIADSEKKYKDMKELKINTLEKLLAKIAEYDGLLLKQTAPTTDPNAPPQRRKSLGQDLYTLPTHLHLTARLLDLHTQGKRVTVIKKTEAGNGKADEPPMSATDKKLLEGLKNSVAKQLKQLEESDKKRIRCEEENTQLKRTNEELKNALEKLKNKPPEITISQAHINDEVNKLKAHILAQDKTIGSLQEQLEVSNGIIQSIVNVTLGKADRLNNHKEFPNSGDDCLSLPTEVSNGFGMLEKAISGRLSGLQQELNLVISLKDLLEGEVGTANLQKDIIQKDLVTVTEQHDALKAAYDALSYETARQQSSQQQQQQSDPATQQLLERAEQSNQRMSEELAELKRKMTELENWPHIVAALEEKLSILTAEKSAHESMSKGAKEEAGHYKKLTETLKQKIRDMSGSSADSKEFLDSFEEVMQEEMMTMKAAFESKLRMAKEEADTISRKHQQEISRISSSSPYASLARLNVPPNL